VFRDLLLNPLFKNLNSFALGAKEEVVISYKKKTKKILTG